MKTQKFDGNEPTRPKYLNMKSPQKSNRKSVWGFEVIIPGTNWKAPDFFPDGV